MDAVTPTPTTPSPEAEALPTLPVVASREAFEARGQHSKRLLWKRGGSVFAEEVPEGDYVDAGVQHDWLLWLEAWQEASRRAPAEAAIVALRAEVTELRKDAERYRWLREHACNYSDGYDGPELAMRTHGPDWPAEIDAAIDTARASLLGDGGTL